MFCAVDNFPTEFPKEASQWFGDHLLPFMEQVVSKDRNVFTFQIKSDMSKPYDQQTDLPDEIRRAVIACHGKLTPRYEYIMDLRRANEKTCANLCSPLTLY